MPREFSEPYKPPHEADSAPRPPKKIITESTHPDVVSDRKSGQWLARWLREGGKIGSEPTSAPTEPPGFDPIKEAREAQDRMRKNLNASEELSKLKDEKTREAVQALIDRLDEKVDTLIAQGSNASGNQVLVVIIFWSESEDELASRASANEADREILRAIQGKFAKARAPFWAALAALGKVKEWSATLEISAGFFAVKGTGGISVTFGR